MGKWVCALHLVCIVYMDLSGMDYFLLFMVMLHSAAAIAPLQEFLLSCRHTSHRMLPQCDGVCPPQTSIIIYVYYHMDRYMSIEYSMRRLMLHIQTFIA